MEVIREEKRKNETDPSDQRERNGICDEKSSATNTSKRVREDENVCGNRKATNKEKEKKSHWKESDKKMSNKEKNISSRSPICSM